MAKGTPTLWLPMAKKSRLAIPYGWPSPLWPYLYPYMAKRDGQKEAHPSALWPKRAFDHTDGHPHLRAAPSAYGRGGGLPLPHPYGPERGALAMRRPKRPSDREGGFSRAKGADPPAAALIRPLWGPHTPPTPTYAQRVGYGLSDCLHRAKGGRWPTDGQKERPPLHGQRGHTPHWPPTGQRGGGFSRAKPPLAIVGRA